MGECSTPKVVRWHHTFDHHYEKKYIRNQSETKRISKRRSQKRGRQGILNQQEEKIEDDDEEEEGGGDEQNIDKEFNKKMSHASSICPVRRFGL